MWLPNLADVTWMTDVLWRHGGTLGLPGEVATVQLLDARLTHPQRPESLLCRGWATYLVMLRDAEAVHLYVKGFPAGGASGAAWQAMWSPSHTAARLEVDAEALAAARASGVSRTVRTPLGRTESIANPASTATPNPAPTSPTTAG